MNLPDIPVEIRRWVALAVVVIVLIFIALTLAWCNSGDVARERAQTENATGKALDTVARKTEDIRDDQEEKQRAVDEIEGSDTRLPDGYGARLECVRRGSECRNP
jgi:hypothetical protein